MTEFEIPSEIPYPLSIPLTGPAATGYISGVGDDFTTVGLDLSTWAPMNLGPVRHSGNSWVTLGTTSVAPSGVWPGGITTLTLWPVVDGQKTEAKVQADNWVVLQLSSPTSTGFAQAYIQLFNAGTTSIINWGVGTQQTNQSFVASDSGSPTTVSGGAPYWLKIARNGSNLQFFYAPDSSGSPGSYTAITTSPIPTVFTTTGVYVQLIGINGLVDAFNMAGSTHSSPPVTSMTDHFNYVDWINWTGWDRGFPADDTLPIKRARTYKGRLQMGGLSSWSEQLTSCHRWELADSEGIFARVTPVPDDASNTHAITMLGVSDPVSGSAYFSMYVDTASTSASGNFWVEYNNGLGTTTDVSIGTYNSTTHAWWRLQGSGSNILAQTAPDSAGSPGSWTTKFTIDPVFGPDVKPFLRASATSGDASVLAAGYFDGINTDALSDVHDIANLEDDFADGVIGPKWSFTDPNIQEISNELCLTATPGVQTDAFTTHPFFMQAGSSIWFRVPAMSAIVSGGTTASFFLGVGEYSRHEIPGTHEHTDTFYGYSYAVSGHFAYNPTVNASRRSTGVLLTVASTAPTATIKAGDFIEYEDGGWDPVSVLTYTSSDITPIDLSTASWIMVSSSPTTGYGLSIFIAPDMDPAQKPSGAGPVPKQFFWNPLNVVSLYTGGTYAYPFPLSVASDVRLHAALTTNGHYMAYLQNLNFTNRLSTVTYDMTSGEHDADHWPFNAGGPDGQWWVQQPVLEGGTSGAPSDIGGWMQPIHNEVQVCYLMRTWHVYSLNEGDSLYLRMQTMNVGVLTLNGYMPAWQDYGAIANGYNELQIVTEPLVSYPNITYYGSFQSGLSGASGPGASSSFPMGFANGWVRYTRSSGVIYMQIAQDFNGYPGSWTTLASLSLDDYPFLNSQAWTVEVKSDPDSHQTEPAWLDGTFRSLNDRVLVGGVNTVPAGGPVVSGSLAHVQYNFHGGATLNPDIWGTAYGGSVQAEGWGWLGADSIVQNGAPSSHISRARFTLPDGDSFYMRVIPPSPRIPLDWFIYEIGDFLPIEGRASIRLGSASAFTGSQQVLDPSSGSMTVTVASAGISGMGDEGNPGVVRIGTSKMYFYYDPAVYPVSPSINYDPTQHAWIRFRRSGTNLWIDSAPDSSNAPGSWSPQVSGYVGDWINNTDLYVQLHSVCANESPSQYYSRFSGFNTTVSAFSPTASGTAISVLMDDFENPIIDTTKWDTSLLIIPGTSGGSVDLNADPGSSIYVSIISSQWADWVMPDGDGGTVSARFTFTDPPVNNPNVYLMIVTEPQWGGLGGPVNKWLSQDYTLIASPRTSQKNPSSSTVNFHEDPLMAWMSFSGGDDVYPYIAPIWDAGEWPTGYILATDWWIRWNASGFQWVVFKRQDDNLVMYLGVDDVAGAPSELVEQMRIPIPIGILAGERLKVIVAGQAFDTGDTMTFDAFNIVDTFVINPALDHLHDDFDAVSISTVKWDLASSTGYTATGTRLSLDSSGSYIKSFDTWSLPDNTAVYTRAWPDLSVTADYIFGVGTTGGSFAQFRYNGGTLHFESGSPSETSSVSYNRRVHGWWQIRRSGTQLVFETSPPSQSANPGPWTVLFTTTLSPDFLTRQDFYIYAEVA